MISIQHQLVEANIDIDTTLCDKVCQWLATGQWFSPGTPFSSTNKTDRHDIAEILLKVALNTINQPTIRQLVEANIDTTLCDKVCQWLTAGRWFSVGNPVSSNNKTNHHDITVKMLKVSLNNNHSLTELVSGDQYMVEYA